MIVSGVVITKIISVALMIIVIQLVGHWKYRRETMRVQFEGLLGRANAFISGLLMASSLVYLLPESYKQHNMDQENQKISVVESEFPWIFSVFCISFGVATIFSQYNTFDKFVRQRVVSDYLSFQEEQPNYQDNNNNIGISGLDLEQSNAYKSLRLNSDKLTTRNPKDSIASAWLSYAPSPFGQGGAFRNTNLLNNEDDYLPQQSNYNISKCIPSREQQQQEQNNIGYNPSMFYLFYCFHSFFECSAIGLQSDVISTVLIGISVILHKWFEVLFIQIQQRLNIVKYKKRRLCDLEQALLMIYTIANLSGIAFGWISIKLMSSQAQAIFSSISAGTLFSIAINDLLHAEISRGNSNRISKIILFLLSTLLVNLAWFAEKQV